MPDLVETPASPGQEGRLGPIGRARASLAAVEVLLRLREDQATPTADDLAALRHWPGWGPLAPALSGSGEGTWAEIGEQLRLLLSPREYRHAEQGTPTAYYTPDHIAEACWTALQDLGFRGGRVLEPGCGAGTFINHTPPRLPVQWFGVERDPTTAGIAALLHPDAEILNARLQDAGIQSNSVDAVLGNVPYGNYAVHDKTAPVAVTASIHNYFIWRSVQALRPGGVAILLTSRYTLDSQSEAARLAIARHADLLGAVRLPNKALAEGGTDVMADVLVLRRRDTDGPPDASWLSVTNVPAVSGQYVNQYFLAHPENVLGTFEQGRAAQYGHTLAVTAPEGQDLSAALAGALDGITAAARDAGREWRVAVGAQPFTEETLPFPVREDGRKEGSFHLVGGRPHEVIDGEMVPVERAGKELPRLIVLRDATLKLIEAESDYDTPDAQLEPLRAEVNRLYDAYARAHGPINRYTLAEGEVDEETGEKAVSRRYPRLGGFRRDPDVVAVLALEDFNDETQIAQKAPLLLRRVNRRIERATSAQTPEEALSLCLNFTNRVDVSTVAQLLGIEEDQVEVALGELVFPDPDTGDLLPRGTYLSGQVVEKLERAEFLLTQGRDDLQRHVDALREVQPEPLQPEDIRAKLGATWIPAADVTAFAQELLGTRVDIVHVARTATWNVDQPMTVPESATSEWGTSRVNAFELLDLALNGQSPKVYDTIPTPDGGSRRVRNDKETMLAESKLTALTRRFASWVWEDPDRADRLAADYNRLFNSTVLPKHDGSHLTVDGMDPEFTPYGHQWDFVQRVLSADEGSLCPYPVGAGKTATMFMTALKLKQLGLVNKPMIVVPNHLLEQISRDGKKLFPNAKILMAGKKDLADSRARMLFAARCATGDWDAIVMTHNSFGRLGVHPITEATYLEELANEYRVALSAVDGDDANQRRIKEIAKMVDRFDARASDLRSKATDAGVSYENLGIDFLQVDEAHLFKNLGLPATTEGMSLGKPSKRATDLDLKLIITRERTGRDNVVALYSGTFISNSVREMYVFQHYAMPKRLKKLGLGVPDAWAANHINFESRPEVGVDGVSFRLKRRPVDYSNADEALGLFAEVAELRPPESFGIKRPDREDRFVEIEATPNLIQYVSSISDRIDLIQSGRVKPFEDNMLNVITDGRKAALDLELVGMVPDGPGKAGAIVREVLKMHEETKDLKLPGDPEDVAGGLQLIFCDLGTPSKERGSQVYGKIRRGLIDGLPEEGLSGIPRERIRFIHDYNSDLAKEQLFSDARGGKVSVLFMSSEKGATGVNVQTRGVALHHADPPHKPAEWEQREGRFWRPGNGLIGLGMKVQFFRYLAKNSFDSYMFQQLERKQRPIVQIMSGRKVGRVIQEIDPVGAGFGQAKAIVAGNPLLMELADVNGELTVLLNEADGHRQAQGRLRRKVEVLAAQIREAEQTLPGMRAMADAVAAAGDDTTWRTADGRVLDPEDVPGLLAQTVQGSKPTLDLDAGYLWRGVNVGFTWHRLRQFGGVAYEARAYLVSGGHEVEVRLNLSWLGKGQSWRIVKALAEAADAAVAAPVEIEQKTVKQRAALEDAQSYIGRPFDKHDQLEAVRQRKAALEAQIEGAAVASGKESQSGPRFDPDAAGAEMTEADMALHDAAAMVGMLGSTAVVVSDGQFVGGARLNDGPTAETVLPEKPPVPESSPDADRQRTPTEPEEPLQDAPAGSTAPRLPQPRLSATPGADDTRTPAGPTEEPLRELTEGFEDRVAIGHVGGPHPAPTHQSAGWVILGVLSDDQVRGLVSAVAVDSQPVGPEPGATTTDRVREWIADQRQAPTAAFYASNSPDLPPALRGGGNVRLSSGRDGLALEQDDVSTVIPWEELPAWIDAAVAHDSATRSPYLPAWSYGRLDWEIHFRRGQQNQAEADALAALAVALRESAPPTDERLAEARTRFAPAVPAAAADTTASTPSEESAPPDSLQRLPENAGPVPGAEGYHYTEQSRTVLLYTDQGDQVGTAEWSHSKYRYEGDVYGDFIRGTEDAAVVAKRMANHHAVVYGDRVHRPPLDDQGRDPVWILHNGNDTLVYGVRPEDGTARAAMWTGGGFKESRKVGGWYLPRTWKETTRQQRVDDAVRVLEAAGRTVTVYRTREGRHQPQQLARLPELNVAAPDLEVVPSLFDAPPLTAQDDAQSIERLEDAYERWSQHPTVVAYLNQDRDVRPNGFGTPDNPVAQLHFAYTWALAAVRQPVAGGPDEIVRRIYGVAAWCQALEPAVDAGLLEPLQEVYKAAHLLAARAQSTIRALAEDPSSLDTETGEARQPKVVAEPALSFAAMPTAPAGDGPAAEDLPAPAPAPVQAESLPVDSAGTTSTSPEPDPGLTAAAGSESSEPRPEVAAPEAGEQRQGWNLVDGEKITYRGQWDGRYEIALPGDMSYLLFFPSIEHRRTQYSVSLNDQPAGITPRRLRRFSNWAEIMPWVRSHASRQQDGYVFRDGAWIETVAHLEQQPPAEAIEDGQITPSGADTAPGPSQLAVARSTKLAQAAWRTRVRRYAEELRESPDRARDFGDWYIKQGWESPKNAPLAELYEAWQAANPRPVTKLERDLGLEEGERYFPGRLDGDHDIQASDGTLYVLRRTDSDDGRAGFSLRYAPDPDQPWDKEVVAQVGAVGEVMPAVREHVMMRIALAPPVPAQEELFSLSEAAASAPAVSLSPPAGNRPTPDVETPSAQPSGAGQVEADGNLLPVGTGASAEAAPAAAVPERPTVEWDGEGLEPTGELVDCSGYLYQLHGVRVGTPEEFWCAKRLPLELDAAASHIKGGRTVGTRAEALAWAEAEGAERRAHRDLWDRHPPLMGPLRFSSKPVITELEPGYESVVQFGTEYRLFTNGKRVEAASARSAPGNKYQFLIYGGTRRAEALSSVESLAFWEVPSGSLSLVGPHPRTDVQCVCCAPGSANGRSKTLKAEVGLANGDQVLVCVPGHFLSTGLLPQELLAGLSPREQEAAAVRYVREGVLPQAVPSDAAALPVEPLTVQRPPVEAAEPVSLPDVRERDSADSPSHGGEPPVAGQAGSDLELPGWMSCHLGAVVCGYCGGDEPRSSVVSEHPSEAAAEHYAQLHLDWHRERGTGRMLDADLEDRAVGLLWSTAQAEVVGQALEEELYRVHDGYVVLKDGSRGSGRSVRHQRVSGLIRAGFLEEVPVPGAGDRTLVRATADGRTALRLWNLVGPTPVSRAGELDRPPVLRDGDQHHRIAAGAVRGLYNNQGQELLFNLRKEVTDPKEKTALRKRVNDLMNYLSFQPRREGLGRLREPEQAAPALPLTDSDLRAVLLSLRHGELASLAAGIVAGDVRPWVREQKASARRVQAGPRADDGTGVPVYDDLQQVGRGISVRVVTPDQVRGGLVTWTDIASLVFRRLPADQAAELAALGRAYQAADEHRAATQVLFDAVTRASVAAANTVLDSPDRRDAPRLQQRRSTGSKIPAGGDVAAPGPTVAAQAVPHQPRRFEPAEEEDLTMPDDRGLGPDVWDRLAEEAELTEAAQAEDTDYNVFDDPEYEVVESAGVGETHYLRAVRRGSEEESVWAHREGVSEEIMNSADGLRPRDAYRKLTGPGAPTEVDQQRAVEESLAVDQAREDAEWERRREVLDHEMSVEALHWALDAGDITQDEYDQDLVKLQEDARRLGLLDPAPAAPVPGVVAPPKPLFAPEVPATAAAPGEEIGREDYEQAVRSLARDLLSRVITRAQYEESVAALRPIADRLAEQEQGIAAVAGQAPTTGPVVPPKPDFPPEVPAPVPVPWAQAVAELEPALRETGAGEAEIGAVAASLRDLDQGVNIGRVLGGERLDGSVPAGLEELTAAIREIERQSGWYLALPVWSQLRAVHSAAVEAWSTVSAAIGAETRLASADRRIVRVLQGVSAAACRSISSSATLMASELTRRGAGGSPVWRGLRNLSRRAEQLAAGALGRSPDPKTVRARDLREAKVVAAARQERVERLAEGYSGRRAAAAGSRRVAANFVAWASSKMGRALVDSDHPRVAAFRTAWRSLPAADLPDGPVSGVRPYTEVARAADALVAAAQASDRFEPADVQALAAVASAAQAHTTALAATGQAVPPRTVVRPARYATRLGATGGALLVTDALMAWQETEMGRQLMDSQHPRVSSLRRSWQSLPPTDLPAGPGSGVHPYHQVAEGARALVQAAQASGRFGAADVLVLSALAMAADQHCARLAVTAGVPVPSSHVHPVQQAQQMGVPPLAEKVGASLSA
ncbi:hypothetical protein [Kitasatospora griseola]|uniref:hypothetical protein n=1 Tax=Kitasatospora griseola TaxID=2064 RepID=UPI003646C066